MCVCVYVCGEGGLLVLQLHNDGAARVPGWGRCADLVTLAVA